MKIMKIIAEGLTFEKSVDGKDGYVFNEYGQEIARFDSYAKDFIEFDVDVTRTIRTLKTQISTVFEDDSWVIDLLSE